MIIEGQNGLRRRLSPAPGTPGEGRGGRGGDFTDHMPPKDTPSLTPLTLPRPRSTGGGEKAGNIRLTSQSVAPAILFVQL